MNKKMKFIVVSILILMVAVLAGFMFNKTSRFDAKNASVEFITNSEEESRTVLNLVEGQGTLIVTEGGSQSERGLTADQQEKTIDLLSRVTVIGKSVPRAEACSKDDSAVNSWVTIKDSDLSATKYFCSGVGVDEDGNLQGPVQDILRTIRQIETVEE